MICSDCSATNHTHNGLSPCDLIHGRWTLQRWFRWQVQDKQENALAHNVLPPKCHATVVRHRFEMVWGTCVATSVWSEGWAVHENSITQHCGCSKKGRRCENIDGWFLTKPMSRVLKFLKLKQMPLTPTKQLSHVRVAWVPKLSGRPAVEKDTLRCDGSLDQRHPAYHHCGQNLENFPAKKFYSKRIWRATVDTLKISIGNSGRCTRQVKQQDGGQEGLVTAFGEDVFAMNWSVWRTSSSHPW